MKTMRTEIGVVLALLAVLLLPAVSGAATYKDGTFMGWSDGDRHGYSMAIVTVANDKIVNVVLMEFNQTGAQKPETYPWPQYHTAMEILPQRFVDANGVDIDLDGLSQATGTVTKAKQAVARALDRALVNPKPGKYQDGTFYGIATPGERSTGVAWVTIKDDKIVAVEVDELLPDGSWKDWPNYPYPLMLEAMATMEQRFVEAQGPDVDIVSGATGSAEMYIEAVKKALQYATR